MKRRTISLGAFLRCANGTQFCSINNNNRKYFTFSLLLLLGAPFVVVKGQTVNYNYDASGNVISKVVVQPLDVASSKAKKDSVPAFTNFFAYYSPFKLVSYPERVSTAPEKVVIKTSEIVNNKTSVTSPLSEGIERSLTVADKKKDCNPN